jgi:sugar/nucleoside kinase (ribokinase family)
MRAPAVGCLAHVAIDVLDGATSIAEQLGGAGLYAALGARIASDDDIVVSSGVGRDLDRHRDFFARWELDVAGLDARGPDTPRTIVTYDTDGSRCERSALGDDHFASMAPRLADLTRTGVALGGIYTFHDDDPARWSDIAALRQSIGCTVLVELSALDQGADGWRSVTELLPAVDIVSLNADEAAALTSSRDPSAVVDALVAAGAGVVIMRVGAGGSFIGTRSSLFHVAATPVTEVVDPTGAGNMYSGAFLAACVAGASHELAGRTAAAAASFALQQLGPPDSPPDSAEVARRVAATRSCA